MKLSFLSLAVFGLSAFAAQAQTERVVVNPATGVVTAPLPLTVPAGQFKVGTQTLTLPNGTIVGTSDTQTLTNKTISGASNTLSNIAWSAIVSTPTSAAAFGIANGGQMDNLATQGQDGDAGSIVYQNEPVIYGATSASGAAPAYAFAGSHATGLNWDGTNLALYTANGVALSVTGSTGAITIGGTLNVGATTASSLSTASVNNLTFTDPGTGSGATTVTMTAGKTFSVANTVTLQATDGSTLNIGAGGTLGTAAYLTAGVAANNVVQLDGSAKLPAVDGSQLTNLPSSGSGTQTAWQVYCPPGASVNSGTPFTPDGSIYSWNPAESQEDPLNLGSSVAAITPPAGLYLMTATVDWYMATGASNEEAWMYITRSGAIVQAEVTYAPSPSSITGHVQLTATFVAYASGSDTFTVTTYQTNDSADAETLSFMSLGAVLSK